MSRGRAPIARARRTLAPRAASPPPTEAERLEMMNEAERVAAAAEREKLAAQRAMEQSQAAILCFKVLEL